MNEGIIEQIFKHGGLGGLAIALILFKTYKDWNDDKKESKEIETKKQSGEYVSYMDVKRMGIDLDALTAKLNGQDVKMAKMETEQDYLKESIIEFRDNQKEMFKILTEMRSHIIKSKE